VAELAAIRLVAAARALQVETAALILKSSTITRDCLFSGAKICPLRVQWASRFFVAIANQSQMESRNILSLSAAVKLAA